MNDPSTLMGIPVVYIDELIPPCSKTIIQMGTFHDMNRIANMFAILPKLLQNPTTTVYARNEEELKRILDEWDNEF